jgi:hypothetical protein
MGAHETAFLQCTDATVNRFPPLAIPFSTLPPDVGPSGAALLYTAESLLLEAESALDVFEETAEHVHMAIRGEHSGWQELDVLEKHREAEALLPYLKARRLMSAKAFVASLARFGRTLDALADEVPGAFANAARAFEQELPLLRGFRNSAEHVEDRIRLRGPSKQVITPSDSSFVGIDNLIGARLQTLQPDGRQAAIDVSEDTLEIANRLMRGAVETVVPSNRKNALPERIYLIHTDLLATWRCCKCEGGPYDGQWIAIKGGCVEWVGAGDLIVGNDHVLLAPPPGGVYRLAISGTELIWFAHDS